MWRFFLSFGSEISCLALVCDWGRNKKWSREKSATSGAKVSNEKKEQKRLPKNHRHSSLWFQTHSLGIQTFKKSLWNNFLDLNSLKIIYFKTVWWIFWFLWKRMPPMGSCLSVQTPRQTPSRHRDRPRTVDKKSINHFNSNLKCQILLTVSSSSRKILTVLWKFSISGPLPLTEWVLLSCIAGIRVVGKSSWKKRWVGKFEMKLEKWSWRIQAETFQILIFSNCFFQLRASHFA